LAEGVAEEFGKDVKVSAEDGKVAIEGQLDQVSADTLRNNLTSALTNAGLSSYYTIQRVLNSSTFTTTL
jgi:hypothetical protein